MNSDEKIIFCKKCVESNQRYIGSVSFFDMKESRKQRTIFDNGICGACKYFEYKKISIGNQEKRSLFLFLINIEKKWRLRRSYSRQWRKRHHLSISCFKIQVQNESTYYHLGSSPLYRNRMA